ncbi:hypothetical protein NQ317_002586 [Molorchus minor]|uniref:Sorting nexin-14 n=1 Tax=Molorchus minor TaxID=1323400 RepID=A0ABQ9JUJ4_9CUCU|nr:hypothetical protein NQ317_002586 [Molorchus minor]
MDTQNILEILGSVTSDKFIRSRYVTAWFLIKYPNKVAEYLQRIISFYRGHISCRKTLGHSCSICDDLTCKRYKQAISVTPWKHLHISKDLNEALEQFYDRIIENFITSWYGEFTEDCDFFNELRYCFRYASAMVINLVLQLDMSHIITYELVPCAIKHIDDYMYIQQIAKLKNLRFNDIAVEYLVLMKEILAGWVLLPLMDVLADPNIINSLVILAVTYKSKKYTKSDQESETVEFLEHYTMVTKKQSAFATNLNKIKNNTNLLYSFMQFLKKQEHVNLLQFCLDVDDFNVKLLTPDLPKKQLEALHTEAVKLYKDYLDKESFDFIGCPVNITEDFNYTVKDISSVHRLTKLSKILYRAYEHTFTILENIWLPQFFHSNEFYSYICGSKIVPYYNKPYRAALTNFGSPIKDRSDVPFTLAIQVHESIEQIEPPHVAVFTGFVTTNVTKHWEVRITVCGTMEGCLNGFGINYETSCPAPPPKSVDVYFPNLSKKYYDSTSQGTVSKISSSLGKIKGVLKTTQPIEGAFFPLESQNVEDGTTSPSNKVIYFCVNVERLDILADGSKKNWVVLRKDQDFYTLKAKLVEFHGENEICDSPLPSRRAGSSLDTRMVKYEAFLKRLLQKPMLRGSDLLYSFLTIEEDFSVFIATNASNIQDIGNIYQSVAYKLRKEKGQHLDSFMLSFLNSTGRGRNEKVDYAEVGEELDADISNPQKNIPFPKTYRNHIFNDNFGVEYKSLKDSMIKHIFKLKNGFLKIYVTLCSFARQIVNLVWHLLIEHVIFHPHSSPTKEELEIRKEKAFAEIERAIPPLVIKILGKNMQDGLRTLLEMLQNPHYNKQVAYNLMDIVLVNMFPSLKNNEDN